MRTIIAGGRKLPPKREYRASIDAIHRFHPITEVVSGCASGADSMGEDWAAVNGIKVKRFPANWNLFGRSAGPRRNRQMAEYADRLIAFPGGRGTANMVHEARKLGLKIYDLRKEILIR